MIIGCAIALIIVLSSFVIKAPDKDTVLPQKKQSKKSHKEEFEMRDYTPSQMVRRFSFWRAFIALICLTAVGSSVISFARDLAIITNEMLIPKDLGLGNIMYKTEETKLAWLDTDLKKISNKKKLTHKIITSLNSRFLKYLNRHQVGVFWDVFSERSTIL